MGKVIHIPACQVGIGWRELRVKIFGIDVTVAENPVEFAAVSLEGGRLLECLGIQGIAMCPWTQYRFPRDGLRAVLVVEHRSLKAITKGNEVRRGSDAGVFRRRSPRFESHLSMNVLQVPDHQRERRHPNHCRRSC